MFYSNIKTVGDYDLSGDISSRISRFVIDIDAVSEERNNSEGYVLLISKMTDEEFALIKSEIETQLKKVPIRLTNCIEGTGYQNFCVNYLFASEEKLFRIRSLGEKSVVDFRKIRESLIEFVIGYVDEHFGAELNPIVNSEDILKNCSIKTVGDYNLYGDISSRISRFVIDIDAVSEERNNSEGYVLLISKMTDAEFALIKSEIETRLKIAPIRLTNCIEGTGYQNFCVNYLFASEEKLFRIRSFGKKSVVDFRVIRESLIEFVIGYVDEHFEVELNSIVNSKDIFKFEKYKAVFGEWIDDFSCEYFNEKKHFPMLRILGNWLRERSEKSRNWSLFFSYFPIFDEDIRPIKELSEEYDLTEERCRQICRIYIKKFEIPEGKDTEGLSAILKKSNEWSYLHERFSSKKIVTEYDLSSLLEEEQSSLSVTFCSFILGIMLNGEYCRVGPKVFPCDADWDWRRNFLISKKCSDIFDFSGVLKEIKDKESTLSEAEYYPAEEIVEVSRCWHDYNPTFTEDISGILSKILIDELEMYPNENDEFKLTAREEVSPTEFIYRIVREAGCPMSLNDVFVQLNQAYPNKYKSSESVNGLVRRDIRLLTVKKGSQVSLSEWKHIRVGGIRGITVTYLSQFDEPQPLSDIVEHAKEESKSKSPEKSIKETLDSGSQFCRFVGNLYGLKIKQYSDNYKLDTSIKPKRPADESFHYLEMFLKSNKRFPSSNSDDHEEVRLRRFWDNQTRDVRKGKAGSKVCEAVERIKKEYSDCFVKLVKRKVRKGEAKPEECEAVEGIEKAYSDYSVNREADDWMDLYNSYKEFVLEYGRKPESGTPEEERLYQWFLNSKQGFEDERLSETQEELYRSLCKIL